MEFGPILSALRRNKVGAALICLQMALTLAILCNALFIIDQRMQFSRLPTGVDEQGIFAITNQWVGQPDDLPARVHADLALLRALPGVEDAYVSNTYPLANSGWATGVRLRAEQPTPTTMSAVYLADEHTLGTLKLSLSAGRNFSAVEVGERGLDDHPTPAGMIITRALADKLFPGGGALGQSVYIDGGTLLAPIIGIVDNLQVPWTTVNGFGSTFREISLLLPFRYVAGTSCYIVRVAPGELAAVMRASQQKLFESYPDRILRKLEPLQAARAAAYRDERALSIMLATVCAVMIAVTGFGIVGLTSYWVTQRRHHIGIRRALGATRAAILLYFQTENFIISLAGVVLGAVLAAGLNLWMVGRFQMERLDYGYAVVGAALVLLLGQLAVIWPSMRAAATPPALVTRGL